MFAVVPLSTDAPIYHFPWMTIVMGVVNIIVFFLTGHGSPFAQSAWMPWVLHLGGVINPIQWVTMNFVHFGYIHLIGNLIFLWGFGLLVEGKIGWWRYLLVYLFIGTLGGALIQCGCYFIPGLKSQAAGASLILYGLLAISLVWAPKNDVTFFYMIAYRLGIADVSILTFGCYYIAQQIVIALIFLMFMNLGMIMFILSQIGHLAGAGIGFAVGVAMFKMGMVDCENWDLFAVWKGTYGANDEFAEYRHTGFATSDVANTVGIAKAVSMPSEEGDDYNPEVYSQKKDSREFKLNKKLKTYLEMGDVDAVIQVYHRITQLEPKWQFELEDLKKLIDLMCKFENWKDAIPFMENYLKRSPGSNPGIRIKLAAILIEVYQRPRRALAILKPLKGEQLKKNQKIFFQRIVKLARKQIQEGVIEFNEDSYKSKKNKS